MITQSTTALTSFIKVINEINGGKLTTEEVITRLHLLSSVKPGIDWQINSKDPYEIELRVDLLTSLAEYPETKKEYEEFSLGAKQIREKAEAVLLDFVFDLKLPVFFKMMSFETLKKVCDFYGKLEYMPVHENQRARLLDFFKWLLSGLVEMDKMPAWFSKKTGTEIKDLVLKPFLTTSLAYFSSHYNFLECHPLILPRMIIEAFGKEKKVKNAVDWYARGIFRSSSLMFGGSQYPSESYEEIIGKEFLSETRSSKIVILAAQVAHQLQKK